MRDPATRNPQLGFYGEWYSSGLELARADYILLEILRVINTPEDPRKDLRELYARSGHDAVSFWRV